MAKLSMASICIDCEEIFEGGDSCPKCGSRVVFPLKRWIRPIPNKEFVDVFNYDRSQSAIAIPAHC